MDSQPSSDPAACERCGRPTAPASLREARVVRKQRIGRAALASPDEAGLLYRTRTHVYREVPARLCATCLVEAEREADSHQATLRRSTMTLLGLAALLAAGALGYAVTHPDAGPDLLSRVWLNTNAGWRPASAPAQSAAAPYRPPFGNLQ